VAKVLERRGDRPGLVHIISAMEACDSYRPWHDKTNGQTFLKPDSGKCLHYYFSLGAPQTRPGRGVKLFPATRRAQPSFGISIKSIG
jgi:hypothetical protein